MNEVMRSGPPSPADIIRLNSALNDADRAVAAIRQDIRDLEVRRQPLRDRLAEMDREGPQHGGIDPALSDALVADPTAAPDMDAITASVSAARKSRDVHAVAREVVQQAFDKIGEQIAEIETQLQVVVQDKDDLWRAFVSNAHHYLVARFEHEFTKLRVDVIEPLLELQELKDSDRRRIIASENPSLDVSAMTVKIARREQSGVSYGNAAMPVNDGEVQEASPVPQYVMQYDRLFPYRPDREAALTRPIDRFRAALPETL